MTRLYVIVDPEHCAGRPPLWIAEQALEAGAAALQLRAKRLKDGALLAMARGLSERCRDACVPFWMNDRADVALLCGAQGVHVGQDDLPPAALRGLLHAGIRIGLSTHDSAQARAARAQGADLIGFGPVFDTRSKAHAAPRVGLDALREVCASAELPVVAIGGIALENAAEVAACGPAYAAVISAVCAAGDPRNAAASLAAALAQGFNAGSSRST
jgi:thiamine-phosphate pyrophosphorylase